MSNRHLSRTIAMQILYEWDFNHRSQKLADLITRHIREDAAGMEGTQFIEHIVRGVTKNLAMVDEKIQSYAPEWPIDKITIIDRNVLRIAIYELLFEKETPPRVIINEAIEMAKTFGGSSSGKFVNGVLGSVFNDLSTQSESTLTGEDKKEVDKTDSSNVSNKSDMSDKTDESILKSSIKEYSVGGVVYKKDGDQLKFALIKDANDRWTFAKGKIADFVADEPTRQALARELQEELGIQNIKILNQVGEIDLVVHPPSKEAYHKKVFYYLVETKDEELKAENSKTVKEVKWVDKNEVEKVLGYENTKEIFRKALQKVTRDL